jgi:hypothetical protein
MFRPVAGVDVPSDRYYKCNPLEPGDNVRRTDIAGVDDMRHSCEGFPDLWTQQAVGQVGARFRRRWAQPINTTVSTMVRVETAAMVGSI